MYKLLTQCICACIKLDNQISLFQQIWKFGNCQSGSYFSYNRKNNGLFKISYHYMQSFRHCFIISNPKEAFLNKRKAHFHKIHVFNLNRICGNVLFYILFTPYLQSELSYPEKQSHNCGYVLSVCHAPSTVPHTASPQSASMQPVPYLPDSFPSAHFLP